MTYRSTRRRGPYDGSQERTGRLPRIATVSIILCLCLVFSVPNYRFAYGGEGLTSGQWANLPSDARADTSKILTALEIKADNEKPIELAKAKLLTIDDKRARLLSRLSERITTDEKSPGSGIAFLLTAVLIILS